MDADRKAGWDRSKYTLDDVQQLNAAVPGEGIDAGQVADVRRGDLAGHRGLGRHAHGRLPGHAAGGRSRSGSAAWASRWAATGPLYLAALDDRITAGVRGRLHVHGAADDARPTSTRTRGSTSCPGCTAYLDLPDVAVAGRPAAAAGAAVPAGPPVPAGRDEGGGREDRGGLREGRRARSSSRAGSTTSRTSSRRRCRTTRSPGSPPAWPAERRQQRRAAGHGGITSLAAVGGLRTGAVGWPYAARPDHRHGAS